MPSPLSLRIAGLGRYLPDRVIPNAEVEERCGLPAGWIERKTGVRERRWVTGETNSSMGARAAEEAVAAAGMRLADIMPTVLRTMGIPLTAPVDGRAYRIPICP